MRILWKLSILLFLVGHAVLAQPEGAPAVPIRAMLDHSAVPAGGQARLAFIFEVPDRHHLTDTTYGLFFVNLTDTLDLHFSKPEIPKGVKYKDEIAYRGNVAVYSTVTAAAAAEPGLRSFSVTVGYQVCQEFGAEVCFLPEEEQVKLEIEVVPAGTSVFPLNAGVFGDVEPPPGAEPRTGLEGQLLGALERGSWLAFLIVFLGGILTSFTPCVYPVIPITVGYIGGRSAGKPLRGLGLAAIFVLGIATVYSSLGLISAATGTLFGSLSGSPYVIVGVAAIFALMGLSMLGAFEIVLPVSWLGGPITLEEKLKGGGWRELAGALLIGMVSGLVMAPCVGPVIVALLAWVAKTQNLLLGWALLFVFSLGLGLLFLVIGTFAGAIQALPKAGAWMEGIKKGFGWILIAAALLLLRPLLASSLYFFLWGVLLVIFAVFSGVFDALAETTGAGKRLWRAVLLICIIIGAIFLYRGLGFGVTAPLTSEATAWQVNQESEVLVKARNEGKPVLIDVYADWCVACKELDEKTYVVPEVAERLGKFELLKLDFTRPSPWVEEMKQKYKITGMPTVIFLDSSGSEITRFAGFKPADHLLALMDAHDL
jgi:thiol:disulfide interchange protein DsbD